MMENASTTSLSFATTGYGVEAIGFETTDGIEDVLHEY
jgi:hypothetical protein